MADDEPTDETSCRSCSRTFSPDDPIITICPDCIGKEANLKHGDTMRLYTEWQKHMAELRAMPYTSYLQSPEWKKTKTRALKNAKRKCQLCSGRKYLQAHHNTYERLGCEADEDMVVLCGKCHEHYHGR